MKTQTEGIQSVWAGEHTEVLGERLSGNGTETPPSRLVPGPACLFHPPFLSYIPV